MYRVGRIRVWQWLLIVAYFSVYIHFLAELASARYQRSKNTEAIASARNAVSKCVQALKKYADAHDGVWPANPDPEIALGMVLNSADFDWTQPEIPGQATMFGSFRGDDNIKYRRLLDGSIKVIGSNFEYANNPDGPPKQPPLDIHYMLVCDRSWPGLVVIGFGDLRVRVIETWRSPKFLVRAGKTKLDLMSIQTAYHLFLFSWGVTGVTVFLIWQFRRHWYTTHPAMATRKHSPDRAFPVAAVTIPPPPAPVATAQNTGAAAHDNWNAANTSEPQATSSDQGG
jgi:hypothetical protein